MDEAETLAKQRACALFGAERANVQPHSGSTANMTAYLAFCKPGDKILGLSLTHGGHLTHGHPVNFSGLLFEAVHYEVEPGHRDHRLRQAARAGPSASGRSMIVGGASAYPRFWDFEAMRCDRRRGRRDASVRHGAHRRPGGRRRAPQPGAALPTW